MYLKILAHPVFVNLNFHMPMIVDLSHPLVMLTRRKWVRENPRCCIPFIYALRGQQVDGYIYRLDTGDVKLGEIYLFDAEAHNPRTNPEFFKEDPRMQEFLSMASHGQVMLSHVPRELSRRCRTARPCCWTSRRWRFRSPTSGAF